ncbi:MAG: hypothetical protein RLY66_683 [Candidatus Parcubacteria bacterium]|jgi:hypothetical protein
MPLEYIFPDHTKRNHKVAIIVECVAAFLAVGLIVWAVWYSQDEPSSIQQNVDDMTPQEIVSQPNPPAQLSEDEVYHRQSLLNEDNPKSSLTPTQIRQRQSLVENI